MLIPAAAFILSSAVVLEILFHLRNGVVGEEEMQLFGITFNSHDILPLGGALVVAVVSGFVLSKLAPGLKAAWDEATHMGDAK